MESFNDLLVSKGIEVFVKQVYYFTNERHAVRGVFAGFCVLIEDLNELLESVFDKEVFDTGNI